MGCRKPDIIEWEMQDRWEEKVLSETGKAEVWEEEEDERRLRLMPTAIIMQRRVPRTRRMTTQTKAYFCCN
jgi:hypothetical protein